MWRCEFNHAVRSSIGATAGWEEAKILNKRESAGVTAGPRTPFEIEPFVQYFPHVRYL
jgi:hypothetical protein